MVEDPRLYRLDANTPLPSSARNCVALMGNMDGVHLGHQALIEETRYRADGAGQLSAAIIFDPHPRRFFQPDAPTFELTPLAHKADLLLAQGIDRVFALTFNEHLSQLSPQQFVSQVLHQQLGLSGILVGEEFQFGKGRVGTTESLKNLSQAQGIDPHIIAVVSDGMGAEKYSSSTIRQAIAQGDMRKAWQQLGRYWSVRGTIVRGERLGLQLGFPTANMALGDYMAPAKAIYAVSLSVDAQLYGGVAYYGERPTVDGTGVMLETHLFDFDGDLYGRSLEVFFHALLREDEKFTSLEDLKIQMEKDANAARQILRQDSLPV